MPIAWRLKRWWNFYVSEDKKKINRTNFYRGIAKLCVSSIQYGGVQTFWDRKLFMKFLV